MLLRRRRPTASGNAAGNGGLPDLPTLRREIATLTEAELAQPSPEGQQRLVQLRHLAGIQELSAADNAAFAAPADEPTPDGDRLPERSLTELTPGLLRAGILSHGCVLVRQLVARKDALEFAVGIERAYAERERRDAGEPHDVSYYDEFEPRPPYKEIDERGWVKIGGGLLAADSPRLSFELNRLFDQAGLPALVSGYLGEPALISAQKTTMRKAEPSVAGAWHQDGHFMGEVRSLNLWLSLSRCGDEAPGLDIVPRRIDHLLPAGHLISYTIAPEEVQRAANGTRVIRPIFEPGDALLFDELFVHQTGSDTAMRKPRFAIENWFFGGSGFPADYAPIAV